MEKIIFFGLIIPIFMFVLYLGGRAIMTGFSAKNSNRSDLEEGAEENIENSSNLQKSHFKKKKYIYIYITTLQN